MSRKRVRSANPASPSIVKQSLPRLSSIDSSRSIEIDEVDIALSHTKASNLTHKHAKSLRILRNPSHENKIIGVASKALTQLQPPTFFPEYTEPGGSTYVYRDLAFWTSGFFPGSLHLLLERRKKYSHFDPLSSNCASSSDFVDLRAENRLHDVQLQNLLQLWTENLHQNARLSTTHDIGFMIMPWASIAYEVNHDLRAFETIKTAALTLLGRFDEKVGCIRSWDTCVTKKYNFVNPESEFLVIIDNMMNLNLLFFAASKTRNSAMYTAALAHARKTSQTHIRPDGSTTHLIVFDPQTGDIQQRLTNQGYSHTSCWARGQAWAIAGFAETFSWTREPEMLDIARRCADHFMSRVRRASGVVPWDFDAQKSEGGVAQPPDSSAAVIAAYGMLLIHQSLTQTGRDSDYLAAALEVVDIVCSKHLNKGSCFTSTERNIETVEYGMTKQTVWGVEMNGSETILNGATINNYEFAPRRWADHGLVYADYYFLLLGNKMLEMGIVSSDT